MRKKCAPYKFLLHPCIITRLLDFFQGLFFYLIGQCLFHVPSRGIHAAVAFSLVICPGRFPGFLAAGSFQAPAAPVRSSRERRRRSVYRRHFLAGCGRFQGFPWCPLWPPCPVSGAIPIGRGLFALPGVHCGPWWRPLGS